MKKTQTFNVSLAAQIGLIDAVVLELLQELSQHSQVEVSGTFYAQLTSADILAAAPYISKEQLRSTLNALYKAALIAVVRLEDADNGCPAQLMRITDKGAALIAECNKKVRKKKAAVDVQALVASYGFDDNERNAVIEWLNFRTTTYGVQKSEQAVKVQCNWLRELKDDDGLDICKIVQYVMANETWQNIKPAYIRKMLAEGGR